VCYLLRFVKDHKTLRMYTKMCTDDDKIDSIPRRTKTDRCRVDLAMLTTRATWPRVVKSRV